MTEDLVRGTSAHAPDLDWSQVRETVLMLELAAGQVDAAMSDSGTSVNVLTDTFMALAETLQRIDVSVAALPDAIGNGDVKARIQEDTQFVTDKVRQAIVAFQFYDKLAQRLDHVCHSLAGLSQLVADKSRLYSPVEWTRLQGEIIAKYTMIEERAMFDAVLHGVPVQQALDNYMAERKEKVESSGGDIELF